MNRYIVTIIMGAALWGTIGWFVNNLYTYGFSAMEVVTLRVVTTAVFLITYFLLKNPKWFHLKKVTDVKYFFGTGILSIVFFNYCLFTAINLSTIPAATALLYTAPAFVTLLSVILFKEELTRYKLTSLVCTLVGCSLVVGVIPLSAVSLSTAGIWFGLGSGLGYALYSIFSKYALTKYSSITITIYTFVIASLFLLPFFPFQEKWQILMEPSVLFYAFGLGIFPTGIAYLLYTYGLNHVEASKASILTTIEPVVATFIGIFVFNDYFSVSQSIGMGFILFAVILVSVRVRKKT